MGSCDVSTRWIKEIKQQGVDADLRAERAAKMVLNLQVFLGWYTALFKNVFRLVTKINFGMKIIVAMKIQNCFRQ